MIGSRHLSSLHRALQFLLLVPFLAMTLMAQGVMPATGVDGRMTLVLCSGDGPVNLVIDMDTGLPVSDAERAPATDMAPSCDWAFGQLAAMVHSDPAPPTTPDGFGTADPIVPYETHLPAHHLRGLWARGPPTLS